MTRFRCSGVHASSDALVVSISADALLGLAIPETPVTDTCAARPRSELVNAYAATKS